MSDIAIEYRVKNARLKRAILAKWPSYAAFARDVGMAATTVSALLGMKKSPLKKDGEWTDVAFDISSAVGLEPEDLWPQYMRRALEKRGGSVELTLEDAARIADARPRINAAILEDLRGAVNPRHWEMLARNLGDGETCDEIASSKGISGGRVNQIVREAKDDVRRAAEIRRIAFSDAVDA